MGKTDSVSWKVKKKKRGEITVNEQWGKKKGPRRRDVKGKIPGGAPGFKKKKRRRGRYPGSTTLHYSENVRRGTKIMRCR